MFLPESFHLLQVIKLFTDRNSRRIEDLDCEGWINDLTFLLDVRDHQNTVNRAL